jgi:hypothetical protein
MANQIIIDSIDAMCILLKWLGRNNKKGNWYNVSEKRWIYDFIYYFSYKKQTVYSALK